MAKILNVVQEGERVRVFVDFDGIEKPFVFLSSATKEEILATISNEKQRLTIVEESISSLKTQLIDTEI